MPRSSKSGLSEGAVTGPHAWISSWRRGWAGGAGAGAAARGGQTKGRRGGRGRGAGRLPGGLAPVLLVAAAVAFEARRDPLGRVGRACREAGQAALVAGRGLLGWLQERRARVLKTLAAGNSGGGRSSPEGKGRAAAGTGAGGRGSPPGAPPPSHGAPWLPEDFVGEDLVSTHMALVDYSSDGSTGTSGSSGTSSPRASPAGTPVRVGSVQDIAYAAALAGEAREACDPAPPGSSTSGGSSPEGGGHSPDAVASHRLADLRTRGGKPPTGGPRRERPPKRQALRPWPLENVPAAEAVPPSFCCPITHERMNDPVIAADGHTYERVAIARWLRHHGTSPSTNLPLKHRGVIPNHSLRSAILDFGQQRADA